MVRLSISSLCGSLHSTDDDYSVDFEVEEEEESVG